MSERLGLAPPAFRLPARTRLGAVRLQVADLTRSLGYYRDVLGLRMRAHDGGRAALAPADERRPLVELIERPGARPVPRGGLLGLYHFAILLPDRASLGRFAVHLAGLGVRAGSADHAVSEAIYLTDPDGLGIEVYADRPRETWRSDAAGQLLMTTDPLDATSLAAAAGGESWTGMPRGTRLGHVHLHVGSLAGAEAFYHRGLGFDKMVWSYPGALFLAAGGYHHHLGTNTWSSGRAANSDDARLLSWDVVVPTARDRDAAEQSLRENGYAVDTEDDIRRVPDPWGTPVHIVADDRTSVTEQRELREHH